MIKISEVFKKNVASYKKCKRFIINQGGTRSTKTYSILQLLTLIVLKYENICIDIVGQTIPHLKQGVLRDMTHICKQFGFSFDDYYNKSDKVFNPNGTINFISFDNIGKAHGGARDILYLNEANHIPYEIVKQLIARTRNTVFIDYNPTGEFWAQTEIINNSDNNGEFDLIKSTYKDNPFLEPSQIKYIESFKGDGTNNFWRVYGLGELGVAEGLIFNEDYDYNIKNLEYSITDYDSLAIGQDFGFNHLNAIILLGKKDNYIYALNEYCCQGKSPDDIIKEIDGIFHKDIQMWCDSANPEKIKMFKDAGYLAQGVTKSSKKIKNALNTLTPKAYTLSQVDWLKQHKLIIHSSCTQLINEMKTWQYKQDRLTGNWLDEPQDVGEDAIKAMLYGCNGWMNNKYPMQIPKIRPF